MTTVVAVHGFAGDERAFDRLRAILGPVVRFETQRLGGHGPSPRPARHLDDEADRLAARVRSVDGPVVLLGYSLGGRVALMALDRCPIAAAVLVSAHPGLVDADERAARLADDRRLAESLRAEGAGSFFDAWEALPLFASQRALPEAVRLERAAQRRAHDPHALSLALERFSLGAMPDRRPAIASAPMPLRFIAGELDAKFGALAVESASIAARGQVDIVPDVGHDVVLEAPDRLAAVLVSVLGVLP